MAWVEAAQVPTDTPLHFHSSWVNGVIDQRQSRIMRSDKREVRVAEVIDDRILGAPVGAQVEAKP